MLLLPITAQGTTTVTWTYDDGNGNTIDQTQDVVIDDITDPVPDSPTLADVTAECSVTSLTAPTATDNCGGTVTVTNDATLPITAQGTTTVTWTYDDGNGNTIDQTQDVVIDDITDPVPDSPTLADVTAECSVTSLTAPTATDNCGGTVTVTNNASLPITAQGTTTVTWTYDDGNGNTIDQTQDVVIDDITDPVPDSPTLADVTAECSVTSLTAPTATDNCGGTVTVTNNASLPITAQGTTTVTWTYDDGNGNTIDQTQDVVIDDITDPVCAATNITIDLAGGTVTITGADINNASTDNCNIASLVATPDTFDGSDIGDNIVTLTVTDVNGNSSNCDVTVTVEDSTLGSQEFEEVEGVYIYPNPFRDKLNINLSPSYLGTTIKIEILDIRGRLIKTLNKEYTSSIVIEEFGDFEDGSYFIKITNKSNKIIFKQLIKD